MNRQEKPHRESHGNRFQPEFPCKFGSDLWVTV